MSILDPTAVVASLSGVEWARKEQARGDMWEAFVFGESAEAVVESVSMAYVVDAPDLRDDVSARSLNRIIHT